MQIFFILRDFFLNPTQKRKFVASQVSIVKMI